jgi:alpha-beta hydrolase superfamily lysophospholipase
MRRVGLVVLGLVAALGAVVAFGPRDMAPEAVPPVAAPADIAGDVATRNADPAIRPGDGDVLIWAGAEGARSDWAVVYLHGFSSSPAELRPVPQEVARALGANLYIPRMTGHGMDGAALGAATAEDWLADTARALAVGRALGDRVLVIATSNGGALATIALADPAHAAGVAGVVLVAPNYGVAGMGGVILDLPWVETWGPVVAGQERSFVPVNAGHAAHWTTRYPTRAVLPVAAVARTARALDHGRIAVPALFVYAEDDVVVDAARIPPVIAAWGGPVEAEVVAVPAGDDPMRHVIGGEILSPVGTPAMVARILAFAGAL